MKHLLAALSVAAVALATASVVGAQRDTSSYDSFRFSINARYVSSYVSTAPAKIKVDANAFFRDYDCTPSYECDRTVLVDLELRRGNSSRSPLIATAHEETGAYRSSARVEFGIPPCRSIPKYKSVSYTMFGEAFAPNGDTKTDSDRVTVRSCRR